MPGSSCPMTSTISSTTASSWIFGFSFKQSELCFFGREHASAGGGNAAERLAKVHAFSRHLCWLCGCLRLAGNTDRRARQVQQYRMDVGDSEPGHLRLGGKCGGRGVFSDPLGLPRFWSCTFGGLGWLCSVSLFPTPTHSQPACSGLLRPLRPY